MEALRERGHQSAELAPRCPVRKAAVAAADLVICIGMDAAAYCPSVPGKVPEWWLLPEPSNDANAAALLDLIAIGIEIVLARAVRLQAGIDDALHPQRWREFRPALDRGPEHWGLLNRLAESVD